VSRGKKKENLRGSFSPSKVRGAYPPYKKRENEKGKIQIFVRRKRKKPKPPALQLFFFTEGEKKEERKRTLLPS